MPAGLVEENHSMSAGCDRLCGGVPRGAQRRVILFFCPMRASSANQISIALPLALDFAISAKRARKFF